MTKPHQEWTKKTPKWTGNEIKFQMESWELSQEHHRLMWVKVRRRDVKMALIVGIMIGLIVGIAWGLMVIYQ